MVKRALAITIILCLSACGGGDGNPQPAPSPQPTDPERFSQIAPATHEQPSHVASQAIKYELGHLPVLATVPAPNVFLTPIQGAIRYPMAALPKSGRVNDRFPIILLLHGNHDPRDPSYLGYDYLARDLAEHGYVAVSVDANAINANFDDPLNPSNLGDSSSVSRGQLILGTLDQLRKIDKSGGPGWMSDLQGKLDFERIGLMGHSRGGQGLTNAIKFNLQRESVTPNALKYQLATTPNTFIQYPDLLRAITAPGVVDEELFAKAIETENIFFSPTANTTRPYAFRGGLLLAPTDFYGTVGLANIPLAVVLPSCDGDVFNLQGARTYDNNRYGFDYDTAGAMQVLVRGANHNYYNTEWVKDDTNPSYLPLDAYCDATRDETPHLSPDDQRRGGMFLINSFMRHFVGNEPAFGPYWNGLAQLPTAACPEGEWPCDARVALTIQQDAAKRLSIHRFEYADSLGRNDLGGLVTLRGFDAAALCEMPYGNSISEGTCMPARLPGFEARRVSTGGLRSIAEHIELSWSSPDASMSTMLEGVSAQNYDTLSFRVAIVRPFGQEIEVSLTDVSGKSSSVKASRFSDALYLGPRAPRSGSPLVPNAEDLPFGNGEATQLMNMVALPLSAFKGLDMSRLKELRLDLPGQSGKIALADVQFQKMGREN